MFRFNPLTVEIYLKEPDMFKIIMFLLLLNTFACVSNDPNTKSPITTKSPVAVVTPNPISMKGYELYTWKDSTKQMFSLLLGTNREKMPDEIRNAGVDFDTLLTQIAKLPKGENLFLLSEMRYQSLFPAELTQEMKNQLTKLCNDKGINLTLN